MMRHGSCHEVDFNPRPPCGGRLEGSAEVAPQGAISIHALRVEGDAWPRGSAASSANFNPRPPCGGRPSPLPMGFPQDAFQSTPSVWRATRNRRERRSSVLHFNPRPPCGGRRPRSAERAARPSHFNPRPPCGGRLGMYRFAHILVAISIHALRVEGDVHCFAVCLAEKISIHALRVEGDRPRKRTSTAF